MCVGRGCGRGPGAGVEVAGLAIGWGVAGRCSRERGALSCVAGRGGLLSSVKFFRSSKKPYLELELGFVMRSSSRDLLIW